MINKKKNNVLLIINNEEKIKQIINNTIFKSMNNKSCIMNKNFMKMKIIFKIKKN